MKQILVVDDEASIIHLISGYLEREGFGVVVAEDGPSAVEREQLTTPDLVILDVMIPGFDGLETCRRIRVNSSVPILMLTAKSTEIDKIVGLGIGADDYLTKPFSPREMVARVKALLRRAAQNEYVIPQDSIDSGDVSIDLKSMTVTKRNSIVHLTNIEFQLLKALAAHPGQVLTKQQLLDLCWGYNFVGDDRLVVVHIANLRKKLEDNLSQPEYILTVRGVGYSFRKE